MKLSLDVDGTLANTMQMWVSIYNEKYNAHKTVSDIKRWDFYKDLQFGLSREEFGDIIKAGWRRWASIQPNEPFQSAALDQLSRKVEIDIVTATPAVIHREVKLWLLRVGIHYKNFVGAHDKELLGYDYYIDDNPNLAKRISAYPEKTLFLYDRPWNKSAPESPNVKRIRLLSDAYKYIPDAKN